METLVQQHPVIFAYQAHQTPRGHSHILIPCEENKGMNAPRFHFHTQLVSFKTAQNIALHKLMCVKENMVSTSTLDQARLRQAEYMLKHVEANENGRFAAITGKHPNIAEAVILFREGVDFLIDHIDDEWQIQPGIYL